ncbi:hypothetical protein D9M72_652890 [compost metagenome]
MHVAVHRTYNRPGITVITSIGESKPRTSCWTHYDTERNCRARLLESVEKLVMAATPKAA